jgi:TonB family protein
MKLLVALAAVTFFAVQDSPVYTPGNGVSLPKVTRQVRAEYTNEARENRIEGVVMLDAVVRSDGTVGDVTVAESLDTIYGLDANAVKAMKQWQFEPGMKDGKAVAVQIHVQIKYTLK